MRYVSLLLLLAMWGCSTSDTTPSATSGLQESPEVEYDRIAEQGIAVGFAMQDAIVQGRRFSEDDFEYLQELVVSKSKVIREQAVFLLGFTDHSLKPRLIELLEKNGPLEKDSGIFFRYLRLSKAATGKILPKLDESHRARMKNEDYRQAYAKAKAGIDRVVLPKMSGRSNESTGSESSPRD